MDTTSDYWVTVCDHCLCASCWHGEHGCQEYLTAGTVQRKASELDKLNREHPDNYSHEKLTEVCGIIAFVAPDGT